jgi:chemotaxis protein methyltransferase CheR
MNSSPSVAVTTNRTSFSLEFAQLATLAESLLAGKLVACQAEQRVLRIWSAACSSGEEVWALAMMLHRLREQLGIRAQFALLGSDVSGHVLNAAMAAKYATEELCQVPAEYQRYFLHSKDKRGVVRVTPELRQTATFFRQNLMDAEYALGEPVDVVLLRTALINFPRERQQQIVTRVCRYVRDDGHLVVGLTEPLHAFPGSPQHLTQSFYQLGPGT